MLYYHDQANPDLNRRTNTINTMSTNMKETVVDHINADIESLLRLFDEKSSTRTPSRHQ
jgi:hypothetical protein